MLRSIIQAGIKLRNPNFEFDPHVTSGMLMSLASEKAFSLFRGFRLLFHFRVPKLLFLGKRVKLFNVANMQFGKMCKIGDYVHLSALGKGKLTIGNNVGIGDFSRIIISTSFNHLGEHITIGDNVGMGEFAYLGGGGGLEIGENCIIGQYFSCHPENHNYEDRSKLILEQGVTRQGIKVGANCWIGSKVTILDGVTIGDNCVLAAGAVITKDMPANSIIGGVPAKVLKSIE